MLTQAEEVVNNIFVCCLDGVKVADKIRAGVPILPRYLRYVAEHTANVNKINYPRSYWEGVDWDEVIRQIKGTRKS